MSDSFLFAEIGKFIPRVARARPIAVICDKCMRLI